MAKVTWWQNSEKLELEQMQMTICDDSQRLIIPDKWVRHGSRPSEIYLLENNIFCLKSLEVGLDSFYLMKCMC